MFPSILSDIELYHNVKLFSFDIITSLEINDKLIVLWNLWHHFLLRAPSFDLLNCQ